MHRRAAASDRGVDRDQIAQRHADAAETDREAGSSIVGQQRIGVGALEPRYQPGVADSIEHDHRRLVERLRQCVVDGDGAVAQRVEVDRHITVEGGGPILDQRLRMGEAELEAEAIDQRLQRRAGRAHRFGHVDEAAVLGAEITGRANRGQDVAGRLVGDDDRHRRLGVDHRWRGALCELLKRALQPLVDSERDGARIGARRDALVGEMRRQHREAAPCRRDRFAFCGGGLFGAEHAFGHHAVEHQVAAGLRGLRVVGAGLPPRASGDCGSALTSSAASAVVSRRPAPCRNKRALAAQHALDMLPP